MSTHCCFALLFPYPIAATDDGPAEADVPELDYFVEIDFAE